MTLQPASCWFVTWPPHTHTGIRPAFVALALNCCATLAKGSSSWMPHIAVGISWPVFDHAAQETLEERMYLVNAVNRHSRPCPRLFGRPLSTAASPSTAPHVGSGSLRPSLPPASSSRSSLASALDAFHKDPGATGSPEALRSSRLTYARCSTTPSSAGTSASCAGSSACLGTVWLPMGTVRICSSPHRRSQLCGLARPSGAKTARADAVTLSRSTLMAPQSRMLQGNLARSCFCTCSFK